MKFNIIPILALTWEEGYSMWEKAQARSDVYNTIFYVVFIYALTYILFFCATGAAGWYRHIRFAPAIIIGGFLVMFAIMIFTGNRSLYWYSWKPNFFITN